MFGWPGWAHVRHFLILWLLVSVVFAVIFGGAEILTAHRDTRLHLFLPGELHIPLVPPMVLAYMSLYLIWVPAPFILRTRAEINRLALTLSKVILAAGVAFVLLPAELGFPPLSAEIAALDPVSAQRWGDLLRFADLLNLDFNLVPSLHAALFVTTAGIYARRVGPLGLALLGLWALFFVTSTVLAHQHHVIDAITGVALGLWGQSSATSGWAGRASTAAPPSKLTV